MGKWSIRESKEGTDSVIKRCVKHIFLILERDRAVTFKTQPEPLLRKALNHMLNFQVAAYVHQIQQGMGVCLELPRWLNRCSTG